MTALFTYKFRGMVCTVFPCDFIMGGGMGFHADCIRGEALEAFLVAKAKYEASK